MKDQPKPTPEDVLKEWDSSDPDDPDRDDTIDCPQPDDLAEALRAAIKERDKWHQFHRDLAKDYLDLQKDMAVAVEALTRIQHESNCDEVNSICHNDHDMNVCPVIASRLALAKIEWVK